MFDFADGSAQGDEAVAADDLVERGCDVACEAAVLFLEDAEAFVPSADVAEVADAVLQGEEAALEVEAGEHFGDELGVVGVVGFFEDVEELFAPGGEGVVLEWIYGEVRREVGELRAGAGVGVGADDDADGGRVEVEEGVNLSAAGDDGDSGAGGEELGIEHPELADAEVGGDGLGFFEYEAGVDAGAGEDVEGAGEFVLVDVSGSFEPE